MMGEVNHEPSMEEILASIKRVIAEDVRAAPEGAEPAAPARGRRIRAAAPASPPAADDDDVLELDEPITEGPTLLSDNAAASTRTRLASLSALRQRGEAQATDQGALEAVVREMLKPMLKEWLDQRLPEIVEELVTREIARLTGRDI
jgi:cell pole-organizing protein PopZ